VSKEHICISRCSTACNSSLIRGRKTMLPRVGTSASLVCSGCMAVYPVIIALDLFPASHVIQAQKSTAIVRPICFETTMRLSDSQHAGAQVAASRVKPFRRTSFRQSLGSGDILPANRLDLGQSMAETCRLHLALSFRYNIASRVRSQAKQQHAGIRRCVSRWEILHRSPRRPVRAMEGRHSTPRAFNKCHEGCWWICGIIRDHGWLDRLVPDKTTGQDVVQVDQALMVCG
jgi:hypothetical protein